MGSVTESSWFIYVLILLNAENAQEKYSNEYCYPWQDFQTYSNSTCTNKAGKRSLLQQAVL